MRRATTTPSGHSRHRRRSLQLRRIIWIIAVLGAVFVVLNLAVWAVYRNRTYPRTSVANATIGSVAYGSLSEVLQQKRLLPPKLTLSYGKQHVAVPVEELGIKLDTVRTVESANRQRSWLPLLNFFKTPRLAAPVAVDQQTMDSKSKALLDTFKKEPVNARLVLTGTTLSISPAEHGYMLDARRLATVLTAGLDAGRTTITIPATLQQPAVVASSLQDDKKTVERQLATVITFAYNGKNKQASKTDIAGWFARTGEGYALSDTAILGYVTQIGSGFGIRVKDSSQVVTTAKEALAAQTATTITLTAQIAHKTYRYCTAVKGVDTAQLPVFRDKLKSTFADPRGWSVNGLVAFTEVSSGCDFTAWLTAAELMPTFGAICDSMWSCRVGPNVVINYTRWTTASPAWNASGGALDEYRNMVINHEAGHWLGFGHSHCPGAGQAAPVMQQQSINLQGCSFNAWPTAGEINSLRQKLGL